MARVDYAAVVADLRADLVDPARPSWGRGQLLERLAALEVQHRVDDDADQAVIQRFADHIADTVTGLLPPPERRGG